MKKEDTKVINLGCRLNFFESEVIKNILNQENLEKKDCHKHLCCYKSSCSKIN